MEVVMMARGQSIPQREILHPRKLRLALYHDKIFLQHRGQINAIVVARITGSAVNDR